MLSSFPKCLHNFWYCQFKIFSNSSRYVVVSQSVFNLNFFLMTNDVEHFFCLLAICTQSFVMSLSNSSPPSFSSFFFLLLLFPFLHLLFLLYIGLSFYSWYIEVYIFWLCLLSHTYIANIFSQSVASCLIFLMEMGRSLMGRSLSFWWSLIYLFFFLWYTFFFLCPRQSITIYIKVMKIFFYVFSWKFYNLKFYI